MHIAVVGGIFDKDPEYVRAVSTPETVLAGALRARGHDVTTIGHQQPYNPSVFDVVHVHHLGYGALRAVRPGVRTPAVYTRHRSVGTSPAGRKGALAEQLVLRRMNGCVALFEAEERALRTRVASVVTIPNGVDDALFPHSERRAPEEQHAWRFLYVGQLVDGKRPDLSLSLLTEWPDAELMIASHNSPQQADVERLARELGVRDRVRFLGRVPYEQLSAVYAQAHLLLLPSDDEALPSVVTEAMLCGLPVVATDVGGVADQVDRAYPVPPAGDRAAFAATARAMLDDYVGTVERARRLAVQARQRYSIAEMGRRHEELYAALSGRR